LHANRGVEAGARAIFVAARRRASRARRSDAHCRDLMVIIVLAVKCAVALTPCPPPSRWWCPSSTPPTLAPTTLPAVVEFADAAANLGKVVIIAALDGDFMRRPFGRIADLLPIAERLDKLTAVCADCARDASFTFRTIADTRVELIGGVEAYVPLCRPC
jgi:hypothetical protein